MKSVLRLSILFILSLFFSCGSEELVVPKQPADVALGFFNSITYGNVEALKENVCFNDQADEAIFNEYLERLFIPDTAKLRSSVYDAEYKVLSEKIEGDTAYAELEGMTVFGKTAKLKVRLLNCEGDWKVDGSQAVLQRID